MADPKEKSKVAQKDLTKDKKIHKNRMKGLVKVQYLEHSALMKNDRGINPGDIAYVGKAHAEFLKKEKRAKILAD